MMRTLDTRLFIKNRSTTLNAFLLALTIALPSGYCLFTIYTIDRYEQAFNAVRHGDSIERVIERFGTADIRELPQFPFLRYATKACSSPCVLRLWWEHPILKDLEAWSVEFDTAGSLIGKSHWASP